MPRENVKRGRRAQAKENTAKRKADDTDGEHGEQDISSKRRRVELDETLWSDNGSQEEFALQTNGVYDDAPFTDDRPFYGLLDEQEQEYFKGADHMLETNQFANQDERALFLKNVYQEAEGKELKLACSQSCSRFLERLIMLSNAEQLKHLFQKFNGNFLHLVQHRFASHCCETLFIKSAPVVTSELVVPPSHGNAINDNDNPFVSMENLFLYAFNELSGNLGYLMTDRFASHTFRILLTLFSGAALTGFDLSGSGGSRKRKKHDDPIRAEKVRELSLDQPRAVPESFQDAMRKMIEESVAGLDPHYLRNLATHPCGSPVLQQLVEHEITRTKKQAVKDENSIMRLLLPDAPNFDGTESGNFINGMLYDTIGSRLVEVIVNHAPGKLFKAMWRDLFRDRFGALARNEIAGYVMSAVLKRLSREDLQVAHDAMLGEIPGLAHRGCTAIIRTLLERCKVRGLDTHKLCDAFMNCWADKDGKHFSVHSMLDIPTDIPEDDTTGPQRAPPKHHSSEPTNKGLPQTAPADPHLAQRVTRARRSSAPPQQTDSASILHRSLLAQTMVSTPGPLSEMIFTSLSDLSSAVCLHIALTSILSPVLQASLTVPHASLIYRRKLITRFYSHIGALSMDASGSHLIDAIWAGTQGMAFVRERVAEELAENEKQLRESSYGRKVWRNWKMDLYQRRRPQWVREMREEVGNNGFQSFPDGVSEGTSRRSSARPSSRGSRGSMGSANGGFSRMNFNKGSGKNEQPKSALDRARERHALKKTNQEGRGPASGNGGNASAVSVRKAGKTSA